MLTNDERFALIDFLLNNTEDNAECDFCEIDFRGDGKLVYSFDNGQHMMFTNIDQLLELLKMAIQKGCKSAHYTTE